MQKNELGQGGVNSSKVLQGVAGQGGEEEQGSRKGRRVKQEQQVQQGTAGQVGGREQQGAGGLGRAWSSRAQLDRIEGAQQGAAG